MALRNARQQNSVACPIGAAWPRLIARCGTRVQGQSLPDRERAFRGTLDHEDPRLSAALAPMFGGQGNRVGVDC